MKECSHCGHCLSEEARFCSSCGKEQTINNESLKCPTQPNDDSNATTSTKVELFSRASPPRGDAFSKLPFVRCGATPTRKIFRLAIIFISLIAIWLIVVNVSNIAGIRQEVKTTQMSSVAQQPVKSSENNISKKPDSSGTANSPTVVNGISSNNSASSAEAFIDCLMDENYKKAALMLQTGLNANARTSGGTPILISAVAANNAEIIRTLIKSGADVNIRDQQGTTALMMASSAGFVTIVDTLLQVKGIDINARASNGLTALQWANKIKIGWDKMGVNTSGHSAVIKLLLNEGAR